MKKMLAKELKNNTEVMEMTFAKFNLQIIQFVYKPYSDDDADCTLIIELSTLDSGCMNEDAQIKINLYDEEGEIYCTESHYICSEEFAGYDTFSINLYNDSRTLLEAKSARLYMSKN